MIDEDSAGLRFAADKRFDRARRQAFIESVLGQLRGQPTSLLSFDDVRESLGLVPTSDRGLNEIPLDKIVGSVGRYRDFTRTFLPRDPSIRERWKRIYAAAQGMEGLPPIEVYQVGDVYFVKDGNHRVSVAREMGAKTIQAYVREFSSPVAISDDTDVDELLLRAEEARFLKHTSLDVLRPEARIQLTSPGYYDKLEEHIAVHGYFLGLEERRDVSWPEVVVHWYDYVYLPLIKIIREHGIVREFPGRTEADLYLWTIEHRYFLAQRLELEIDMQEAAKDFAARFSPRWQRVVERAQRSLVSTVTPDSLEGGAPVGQWRRERARLHAPNQLFAELLVLADDSEGGWCAIEQALVVAQIERATLYGLWMQQDEDSRREAFQSAFSQRCELADVTHRLIAQRGEPAEVIAERAAFVDLVVLGQTGSGRQAWDDLLNATVRRAAPPVLAMAGPCRPVSSALLAYDESPTSTEALHVAAHLAQHWQIPVKVVTVEEPRRASEDTLDRALAFMSEQGIETQGFFRTGPVADTLLTACQELGADLLVMGASGYSPFVELFVRSTLDRVVQQASCPILICH
jgi:nucleotide-binding universal stress UspA family protein